ncbi:MAG: hypothetical protein ACJ748_06650 [Flavisolibacter sp.]
MKKLSTLFIIIGIIVIAGYVYLRYILESGGGFQKAEANDNVKTKRSETVLDLRPKFISRLQQLVKQASNGLYDLSIESVDPDILQSTVELKNITLTADSTVLKSQNNKKEAPDDIFRIKLDSLKITGININDFIKKDQIDIKTINLKGPLVEIFHDPKSYNKNKNVPSAGILDRLQNTVKHLFIEKAVITNAHLIDHNLRKKTNTVIEGMLLDLSDILIDSSSKGKRGIFYSRSGKITVKNYKITTGDKLYNFKIGNVTFASPENVMRASDVKFEPKYSRSEFQSKFPYAKEQYSVAVPSIIMHGIDWWNIVNSESIISNRVEINGGKVDIYLDLTKHSLHVKRNGYPDQLLLELPFPVHIPIVKINNLNVSYSEYHPSSGKAGILYFDHINATVSNVTNIPAEIKKNGKSKITAESVFMHSIPMKADVQFDLLSARSGAFTSQIKMGGFDGTMMNSLSESMGMFTVKRGNVRSAAALIKGDNTAGTGQISFEYNSLHITPIKKDDDRKSTMKKKSIISFVANKFIIKDNNPSKGEEKARTGDSYFKRGPDNSFFNVIWKTALVGILKIIGIPEKFAH